MAVGDKWYCTDCGATMDYTAEELEPLGAKVPESRWWQAINFGEGGHSCRYCGGLVERMEECPVCHGWKRPGSRLCEKCELRAMAKLREFVRGLEQTELEWLDDKIDGVKLEAYR